MKDEISWFRSYSVYFNISLPREKDQDLSAVTSMEIFRFGFLKFMQRRPAEPEESAATVSALRAYRFAKEVIMKGPTFLNQVAHERLAHARNTFFLPREYDWSLSRLNHIPRMLALHLKKRYIKAHMSVRFRHWDFTFKRDESDVYKDSWPSKDDASASQQHLASDEGLVDIDDDFDNDMDSSMSENMDRLTAAFPFDEAEDLGDDFDSDKESSMGEDGDGMTGMEVVQDPSDSHGHLQYSVKCLPESDIEALVPQLLSQEQIARYRVTQEDVNCCFEAVGTKIFPVIPSCKTLPDKFLESIADTVRRPIQEKHRSVSRNPPTAHLQHCYGGSLFL